MIRRPKFPVIVGACLVLLATSVAAAAEDVLDVIPAESLGFAVVNRLAETDGKIESTARKMQLPAPSPLALLKQAAGVKEGLDEARSAAIAAVPAGGSGWKPAWLLFVPVTDFEKFIEPLEPVDPSARIVELRVRPALAGKIGDYAVVTEPTNRAALERALDSKHHLADDVAFLRPWLSDNDVVGVITSHGVKLLCTKAQEGLRMARTVVAGVGDEANPAIEILGLYEQCFAAAEEQVTTVAVGARLDQQGSLRITERVRLASGSRTAEIVAAAKPGRAELLAGLPSGPFVVAVAGGLPEQAWQAMMQVSGKMMKSMPALYGLSEAQVDELIKISGRSMEGMQGMSMLLGVGKAGDPVFSDMIFTIWMDDARGYLGTYQDVIQTMNRFVAESKSPVLAATEVKETDVNGRPALQIESTIPTPPGVDEVPGFATIMEKMFGPGGKMTVFLTTADEKTVVAAYTSKEPLLRGIEAARKPEASLAADESVSKTAGVLPADALWVGYWSPNGTVDFINRLIPTFAPGPEVAFKLPDFPETSPVGFALTTAPDEAQWHLVVPAEALHAIGAYVGEITFFATEDTVSPRRHGGMQ